MFGGKSRHSNRSQQALDTSLNQAQPRPSQQQSSLDNNSAISQIPVYNPETVYDNGNSFPLPPQPYANPHGDQASYPPTSSFPAGEHSTYHEVTDLPARSQSHRVTQGYSPTQLDVHGPLDDQQVTHYDRPYNPPILNKAQPPLPDQKKSKTRGFFSGFSKSKSTAEKKPAAEEQSSHNNLGGLGRRLSVRESRESRQDAPHDRQSYIHGGRSAQSSDSQLQSPQEVEETQNASVLYSVSQEAGLDRTPQPVQRQPQKPPIHLIGGEQDPTVRLVDDNWRGHQQPPPQLHTQQPWIAQQNQQSTHSPATVSPSKQLTDYQQVVTPGAQYQVYQPASPQNTSNPQLRAAANPEVVSQFSHDSPVEAPEELRPGSVQSSQYMQAHGDYPARTTSVQAPPTSQPSAMPPPQSSQAGQSRRSTDSKQAMQADNRNNSGPPPYPTQQSFNSNSVTQVSSSASSAQAAAYKQSSLQREYSQPGGGLEQGRSTPPIEGGRDRDLNEMDKLLIKYKKVKGLYFEKQAQVEQLQNTLANQRLSQSRTSLDDSEYSTRFNRLDGAIKEIAFSIRKDWRAIPQWLAPYVNQDAIKAGTKEMTAVGRAAISRWIHDEIFSKCFHPALEMGLSQELKRIEQAIRYSAHASSQEEAEALTSKVIQWKMATVEGLGYVLHSPDSLEAKHIFTQKCVTNLTAHLIQHLNESATRGIEGNATSIVELAVGLAGHLPLESRDISITYPNPGDPVLSNFKVEQPLPPLENPGLSSEGGPASMDNESKDQVMQDSEKPEAQSQGQGSKLLKKQQSDKNKLLQSQNSQNGKKGQGQVETGVDKTGQDRSGDGVQRVRFAGFVGVEVRGRQWLVMPPVWTM